MNMQNTRTNDSRLAPRAFTLIELLTVIAILAIVIGIILPIMGSARTAAKKADIRVLMSGLAQATAAFENDQRRLPGYFSPRQMGDPLNAGRGFNMMDNILIDLVGGITTQAANGTSILTVGPTPTNTVTIDLTAMGATTQNRTGAISKSYLAMDAKRYVAQDAATGARASNVAAHSLIPALIDSFGSPILAWVGDDVPSLGGFADIDTTLAAPNGARFYQVQNAGFLNATALGKLKEDQRSDTGANKRGSALCLIQATGGGTAVTAVQCVKTLEALLGNASQPVPASATPKPLGIRAPIVFHSAGPDGLYVGLKDKGARAGFAAYTPNQDPFGGANFDDLIGNAGN